jgi:DNA-binding transcriptional regulator GbsR (MarR family)
MAQDTKIRARSVRKKNRPGNILVERRRDSSLGEPDRRNDGALSEAERAIINTFVDAAQALGLPKSIGEIYGLLSCSREPLVFETIREKLRISQGSTSQGLRFLRNIRAVKTTYIVGDRRDYFVAERSLRRLVAGLLRERVIPPLENGEERLKSIEALLSESSGDKKAVLEGEVDRLRSWNRKSRQLLPMVLRFIDL